MPFIHKRHYLLRSSSGRKIVQHTPLFKKLKTLTEFDEGQLKKIAQDLQPSFLQIIQKSEQMLHFWQQASERIRQDLILSYHYHEHLGQRKVLNVETEDWFSLDFFQNTYRGLLKKRFALFQPKQAVRAIKATFGKHPKNLRFENIHLAADKINGKHICQVHWDKIHPTSVVKTIKHFIKDDIFG